MLELVGDGLRAEGHDIVEESDGGRLLVRVAAVYARAPIIDPVDLIVADIRMPVCSGFDILKAIREVHWPTPVILMTAYGGSEVRRRATDLGAVVLDKPFELRTLCEKVRDLLLYTLPRLPVNDPW
jgi:DNA-binding response OmpR family regulator